MADPAAGSMTPLTRATEVATSRALRPARAGLALPETEEGENVMELIYRQLRCGERSMSGVKPPWR
ncbi:MAG TPA: hypothetical protein DD420_10130 [Streptomyces sp.]|nr:hypothetical protein [Streptomyces sp.]